MLAESGLSELLKGSNCVAGAEKSVVSCTLPKAKVMDIKRQLFGGGEIHHPVKGLLKRLELALKEKKAGLVLCACHLSTEKQRYCWAAIPNKVMSSS